MTLFGSQSQRHAANYKTDESLLVYCGKQILGRLNPGQGTLVSNSMWFLKDQQPAHLGSPGAQEGVWVQVGRLNQPPCANMCQRCSIHRKVSVEKLQLLHHCRSRNWTR